MRCTTVLHLQPVFLYFLLGVAFLHPGIIPFTCTHRLIWLKYFSVCGTTFDKRLQGTAIWYQNKEVQSTKCGNWDMWFSSPLSLCRLFLHYSPLCNLSFTTWFFVLWYSTVFISIPLWTSPAHPWNLPHSFSPVSLCSSHATFYIKVPWCLQNWLLALTFRFFWLDTRVLTYYPMCAISS